MAFADLTPEQQSVLADYVRLARAWCGEQAQQLVVELRLEGADGQVSPVRALVDLVERGARVEDVVGCSATMTLSQSSRLVSVSRSACSVNAWR